jgi:hypothetical protein
MSYFDIVLGTVGSVAAMDVGSWPGAMSNQSRIMNFPED